MCSDLLVHQAPHVSLQGFCGHLASIRPPQVLWLVYNLLRILDFRGHGC